jgi:hypothetical protein
MGLVSGSAEPDENDCWLLALAEDTEEPDDGFPEELADWFAELDAAPVSAEDAETTWRALRVIELTETGRDGWELMQAARAAADMGEDLSRLSDAEIIGRAVKCRELASRAQGRLYRALEELLRRRPPRKRNRRGDQIADRRDEYDGVTAGDGPPTPARLPVMASQDAASEIALAFTSTEYAAETLAEQTADLSQRLPVLFAELEAGRTHFDRVRLIWEGTKDLSDEDAGKVDAMLSARSGTMTTGELREAVQRAVIEIDPAAADRRRTRNEKKSRVRLYPNADHTATLAIEQAPAALAAAAIARVKALARAAKSASAQEPVALLESKIALGLLLGTLPLIPPQLPPDGGAGPAGGGPAGGAPEDGGPGNDETITEEADPADLTPGDWGYGPPPEPPEPPEPGESMAWPAIPPTGDAAAPGCVRLPAWLRAGDQGRAKLVIPWRTAAGMASIPGELSWFGPVTPGQARDLARAAAADPATRWTLIVTDDDGRALAVTALRNKRGQQPPGLIDEVTVTIQASLAAGLHSDDAMRHWTAALLTSIREAGDAALAAVLEKTIGAANRAAAAAELKTALDADTGGCAHTLEVSGYRVPGSMRRWLNARDRTCRNPICRRRAAQCDQDHTRAYDKGGRTCTCNLGGLCRLHHQVKQLPGWRLSQDANACFTWTTPAGLTYRNEPYKYAT